MNRFQKYALVLLTLLCCVSGIFVFKYLNSFFNNDIRQSLSYTQLIDKAHEYAKMLGITTESQYEIFNKEQQPDKLFTLLKKYGYRKMSELSLAGGYELSYFSLELKDYPIFDTVHEKIFISRSGDLLGFHIPYQSNKKDKLSDKINSLDQALLYMSRFIDNFSKEYVFIEKKQTVKKQNSKNNQRSASLIDQFQDIQNMFFQFDSDEQFLYHNPKNDKYVTLSFTNGFFTGFQYDLPVSQQIKNSVERLSFQTKKIGSFFLIITLVITLFLILYLRKKILVRDRATASAVSLGLSMLLAVDIVLYYFSILPAWATSFDYSIFVLICLATLIGSFIYYKLCSYLIGLADGIERHVRPGHLSLRQNMSINGHHVDTKIKNSLMAYLFVALKLVIAGFALFIIVIFNLFVAFGSSDYRSTDFSVILTVLQAGILEEIIFRGILFGGLLWIAQKYSNHSRLTFTGLLVLQALLFAGSHNLGITSPSFLHTLVILPAGIVYGALYYMYGLYTAIITHTIYDLVLLNMEAETRLLSHLLSLFLLLIPLFIVFLNMIQKDRQQSR